MPTWPLHLVVIDRLLLAPVLLAAQSSPAALPEAPSAAMQA